LNFKILADIFLVSAFALNSLVIFFIFFTMFS